MEGGRTKILWVCNIPLPRIAVDMEINEQHICGWLIGFANCLEREEDIDFYYAFPQLGIKKVVKGKVGRISYYAFSQPKLFGVIPTEDPVHESHCMRINLNEIIAEVRPDILHIFGTEYPHSLVATEEFGHPEKTVISIQGLTYFLGNHFCTGIPYKELKKFTLSNIVRGNLLQQAKKLKRRGQAEIKALMAVDHVIGRTDWDEACTKHLNLKAQYHFCNESLRDSFYDGIWNFENCEKYSIFMSQAATPIKGIHCMLRALPDIIREYPDTHLYVAGNDLIKTDTIYTKIKISSFAKYVKKLIEKNNLEKNVTFIGPLNEKQMKERFLKSNIFVCPSVIENSPNSLGEAMLLGMPCVSADVGGVKNLLTHEKEGFIYQADAPYMLAYYVKKIFADNKRAVDMGKTARKHALVTHDREKNLETLLSIYKEITGTI